MREGRGEEGEVRREKEKVSFNSVLLVAVDTDAPLTRIKHMDKLGLLGGRGEEGGEEKI